MITTHKRLETCGREAHASTVTVRVSDGVAGIAGVKSCGSVWACSVCSAKIAHTRHTELARGLDLWWQSGGQVAFLTLTMRHRRGQKLADLWDGLSHAWGAVTSGRQWVDEKRTFGVKGWVRTVELTQGANGWHLHIHALLLLKPEEAFGGRITGSNLTDLLGRMSARWLRGLNDQGLTALADVQDMRLVDPGDELAMERIARYQTKFADHGDAIAREIHEGQGKRPRVVGSRTPWGILDDVIRYGEFDDLELWQEYVSASMGRRQTTYGKGTRDLLDIGAERSDEEIADEELGTADDDLVGIPASDWFRISASGALVADVLDVAESEGAEGLLALLDSWGITGLRVNAERRPSD
jgi:hypothetical protein